MSPVTFTSCVYKLTFMSREGGGDGGVTARHDSCPTGVKPLDILDVQNFLDISWSWHFLSVLLKPDNFENNWKSFQP